MEDAQPGSLASLKSFWSFRPLLVVEGCDAVMVMNSLIAILLKTRAIFVFNESTSFGSRNTGLNTECFYG